MSLPPTPPPPPAAESVAAAEYFVDTDPGVGNGTPVGDAGDTATGSFPLNVQSLLDGVLMGTGMLWTLALLGGLRELIGNGTLFAGIDMVFSGARELRCFRPTIGFLLTMLPPGAFIVLGCLIAWKQLQCVRQRPAVDAGKAAVPLPKKSGSQGYERDQRPQHALCPIPPSGSDCTVREMNYGCRIAGASPGRSVPLPAPGSVHEILGRSASPPRILGRQEILALRKPLCPAASPTPSEYHRGCGSPG